MNNKLLLSLFICLTLTACHSTPKDKSTELDLSIETTGNMILLEEECLANWFDIPLTLIGDHLWFEGVGNVTFMFPQGETSITLPSAPFTTISYVPKHQSLYFQDDSTLTQLTKSQTNPIATLALDDYSRLYYGDENEAILYSTTEFNTYSFVVFGIYLKTSHHDFMQIAPQVKYFELSQSGNSLFYITPDNEVFLYDVNSQTEEMIASGYESLYYDETSDVLLLQRENKSVDLYYQKQIYPMAKHMELYNNQLVQLHDGYLYFIDQQQDSHDALSYILADINHIYQNTGILHRLSLENFTVEKVSSKSAEQFVYANPFIYLKTSEGQLYQINDSLSAKLLTDQAMSVFANEEHVYFVTADGLLHELLEDRSTVISTELNLDYLNILENSIASGDLAYLTVSQDLIIHDKVYPQKVNQAVYEEGIIAILTPIDELYYVNPHTLEQYHILDSTSDWVEIYIGDELLKYEPTPFDEEIEFDPFANSDLESLTKNKLFSEWFKTSYFVDSSSYIEENSLNQYLNAIDLLNYTKDELALIRNEIFARYGYQFDNEFYHTYFNSKDWYSGYTKEISLDYIPQTNVDLLLALENGGITISEDISLNGLNVIDAFNIIASAYPNFFPIRYNGITEGMYNWQTDTSDDVFCFLFQWTEYSNDNLYLGYVFPDGSYMMKHIPSMDY